MLSVFVMPRVCVVGSINLDLVADSPRLPRPGETVTGASLRRSPGGKGANQALAARRLGAEVVMVGAVGADAMADEALALLDTGGVDLRSIRRVPDAATGVALIVVDTAGENQITVASGANHRLTADHVTEAWSSAAFDAVLCQFEIEDGALVAAARLATGLFCVNAAPARPVPDEVLQRADVIIVNELEHRALRDRLVDGPALVVVTEGPRGAHILRRGRRVAEARPPKVDAIDTVGAGDAFVAAFVVALASGLDESSALDRGCRAGALATTRLGAQPALPTSDEVDAVV